jgi:hypothetical protein
MTNDRRDPRSERCENEITGNAIQRALAGLLGTSFFGHSLSMKMLSARKRRTEAAFLT